MEAKTFEICRLLCRPVDSLRQESAKVIDCVNWNEIVQKLACSFTR